MSAIAAVANQKLKEGVAEVRYAIKEIEQECIPKWVPGTNDVKGYLFTLIGLIYIPFLPAFWRPGWLKNYIIGPHTLELFESFMSDIWAGVVVALTLLPQGLSYAQLANLPPVHGLYAAVLPSATYTFLGTSMQLGVGPVAIVSLLTGQLVAQYVPTYAKEPQKAIDFAAQVAFICGVYLFILGLVKTGNLIQFISHPVMSGFTSGAAMTIGLSQVKNAFGFPSAAPQIGQHGYDYDYEVMKWFNDNWNNVSNKGVAYINPFAVKITFGIYVPLIILWFIKEYVIPSTPERKKKVWFRIFTYAVNISPLFAIIIGADVAKRIIRNAGTDPYAKALKVVGDIPSGLNILRSPPFQYDWGVLFGDVLPLTLISFMESYSVARRIATQRNELHILNANQELIAIGSANLLGSVSSAFPVSGSFSRSSLNAASGARTPLSKATTMAIICLALVALTTQFYYIPNAALSAIIWVAITALISPSDLWEAWKHSKKDFIVMAATWAISFIVNTEYGLVVGIGLSGIFALLDMYIYRKIVDVFKPVEEKAVVLEQYDNLASLRDVEYVRVYTDINFITAPRLKSYVAEEILERKADVISAIVLDFSEVRSIDLTGLLGLKEMSYYSNLKGVQFAITNADDSIIARINKFGIVYATIADVHDSIAKKGEQSNVVTDADAQSNGEVAGKRTSRSVSPHV